MTDCLNGGACFNFGWPYVETLTNAASQSASNVPGNCFGHPSNTMGLNYPLADHGVPGIGGEALLGGYVYRGTRLDQAQFGGRYFYGVISSVAPRLTAADPGALRDPSSDIQLASTLGMDVEGPTSFVEDLGGLPPGYGYFLAGLGQGSDGEIFLIRLNDLPATTGNGAIFRLEQ